MLMRVAPSVFIKTLPNRDHLLDLLINGMSKYTLAEKYMSMTFIKKVLSGKKLLLDNIKIKRIRNIP